MTPLFLLFGAIGLLLVLIIWVKLNPFLSLVITSFLLGMANGLAPQAVLNAIIKGAGDTFGTIAIVIVCGAAIGKLIEESGAALAVSKTFPAVTVREAVAAGQHRFGENYVQEALDKMAELTDLPLNPALADGAPIGFVYPASGTTTSEGYMFVAAKAPHPNAAKVFANWILSGRGQLLLQTYAGLSATRPGLPGLTHLPPTSALKSTDGLALTPPAKQKQIVDHWRKTFGIQ